VEEGEQSQRHFKKQELDKVTQSKASAVKDLFTKNEA
jgi:hypothetical protein